MCDCAQMRSASAISRCSVVGTAFKLCRDSNKTLIKDSASSERRKFLQRLRRGGGRRQMQLGDHPAIALHTKASASLAHKILDQAGAEPPCCWGGKADSIVANAQTPAG